MSTTTVHRIEERALEMGFCGVGIIPAGPLAHGPHFDRWLADGFHGEMRWIENHRELRLNPQLLEDGLRTVVALAAPYAAADAEHGDPGAFISRYAQGDDYHSVLRDRMRALARFIERESGATVSERPAVDSAPVLERNVALDAGLGWLGRSSMILQQSSGSYFFLAELFLDIELEELKRPQPDRCGQCTACIDLCPTGAIVDEYRVDARRCISYLTIELRGPIPRELRPLIGGHLFGCDICQSVCPWNRKASLVPMDEFRPRPEVVAQDAVSILRMTQQEFSMTFRKSPLKRPKRRGLARNAAVVLGNTGDPGHVGELGAALKAHDEPLVRGHAAWALGRIGGPRARTWLDLSRLSEEDPFVRDEIHLALDSSPQA